MIAYEVRLFVTCDSGEDDISEQIKTRVQYAIESVKSDPILTVEKVTVGCWGPKEWTQL